MSNYNRAESELSKQLNWMDMQDDLDEEMVSFLQLPSSSLEH